MRNLHSLNEHRVMLYNDLGDQGNGAFLITHPATGVKLKCIAGSEFGWDHISVSLPNRCPNWAEMEFIKRKFFEDDEIAMQLHVGVKDHISMHPYVLHLWRPQHQLIPLPPKEFV
jgi:hypothetical protein